MIDASKFLFIKKSAINSTSEQNTYKLNCEIFRLELQQKIITGKKTAIGIYIVLSVNFE